MGLRVNKNGKNEYQLISTYNDSSWHPDKEWITEDEAKKLLINEAFIKFIERTIEIDMTFPWSLGMKRILPKEDYNQWILDAMRSDNCNEIVDNKFEEIYKRLNLDFEI